jgi:hypothetical protein
MSRLMLQGKSRPIMDQAEGNGGTGSTFAEIESWCTICCGIVPHYRLD